MGTYCSDLKGPYTMDLLTNCEVHIENLLDETESNIQFIAFGQSNIERRGADKKWVCKEA